MTTEPAATSKIRLDKWLWFARVVKTRTLAQKLIAGGDVRVDGVRITQTAYKVGVGATLTISVANAIKVLEIAQLGERRGPAPEAQTLYVDHSPVIPKSEKPFVSRPPGERAKGDGRPTKKQRREIDRFNKTD